MLRHILALIVMASMPVALHTRDERAGRIDHHPDAPDTNPADTLELIIQQHFTAIPLVKSKRGSYFVEAQINGKHRWLCVDSGADGLILDHTIAREDGIALRAGTTATGADGGALPTSRGRLTSLTVGSNSFQQAIVTFTDLSNFAPLETAHGVMHPCAGLLGTAYFNALPVSVDFPNARILVARKSIPGGLAGRMVQFGALSAPMIEDKRGRHYLVTETLGRKALFLVDLGAVSCMLFEKAADMLKLETYDIEGTVTTLQRKDRPRKGASIRSLKLGDCRVQGNVEVMVLPETDIEDLEGTPVIGIMGCSVFEVFHATVDFKEDQIALKSEMLKRDHTSRE